MFEFKICTDNGIVTYHAATPDYSIISYHCAFSDITRPFNARAFINCDIVLNKYISFNHSIFRNLYIFTFIVW